jgi:ribonuclease P protein component
MGETDVPAEQSKAGEAPRLPASHVDPGRPGHPQRPAPEGTPQAVGLSTPAAAPRMVWAVRDRATFESLRRSGRRVRRGPITVTWLAGDPAEPPRVAYAIGRRVGGAVVRNRIRRRLRSVMQEVRAQLRPGAYLVGAATGAASLSYGDLRATVCEALGTLHRQ